TTSMAMSVASAAQAAGSLDRAARPSIMSAVLSGPGSLALTCQVEQQLEDVDEVQIERERPEHRHLGLALMAEIAGVAGLDVLRVPGGQADEYQHADHRNGELQRARTDEHVDQAGDQHADHAHDQ